jgi:hypothetical protein
MQIKATDLPEASKSRLHAALKNPPPGTFVLGESKLGWALLGIVSVAIAFFFVFSQADNYKWQSQEKLAYLGLVIGGFIVGWASLKYLISWHRGEFKAQVLINPLYFLRFRFDRIVAIPFTSNKVWNVRHMKDTRGAYLGTKFYFRPETGGPGQTLKTKSIRTANDLIDALNGYPSYVSDLIQRRDNNTLYALDLLYEWRLREDQFPRARTQGPTGLAYAFNLLTPVMIAGLLGALAFFVAFAPYNDYRDDELRWNNAKSSSKATSYRLYLASRPDGRHQSEAHTAISTLYDQAAESYKNSPGSATAEGIEAVLKVLEYAKRTEQYKVFVAFSGDNEIPPDIEQRVRAETGLSQVIPINPSFTPAMNQARETRILERISRSFGNVIPGDILQFAVGKPSFRDVSFVVTYVIRASGEMYYPEKQEHLSVAKRDWYTGISFEWNLRIAVPGSESSTFQLGLKSEPAEVFQVAYTRASSGGSELPPTEVYSSMADSAFDNFGAKLVSQLAGR